MKSGPPWRLLWCVPFLVERVQKRLLHANLVPQKAKGLPLVVLIRLSPMPPWVYANTLFAVSPRSTVPIRFPFADQSSAVDSHRRALAVRRRDALPLP